MRIGGFGRRWNKVVYWKREDEEEKWRFWRIFVIGCRGVKVGVYGIEYCVWIFLEIMDVSDVGKCEVISVVVLFLSRWWENVFLSC